MKPTINSSLDQAYRLHCVGSNDWRDSILAIFDRCIKHGKSSPSDAFLKYLNSHPSPCNMDMAEYEAFRASVRGLIDPEAWDAVTGSPQAENLSFSFDE